MTASKSLFQRSKELHAWWGGISHSREFSDVLIHARAAFMEGQSSSDQILGANRLIGIMLDLCEIEDKSTGEMPTPKIEHDLTVKKNTQPK